LELTIDEYNQNWIIYFKSEKKLLKEIFYDQFVSLNHIGSTSIPNLASKSIVDISIGVKELREKDFYIKLLKTIGYDFNTGSEFENWILFEKRNSKQNFNLHIMPSNSSRLLDQLIFKKCLMGNETLIKHYGWLKKYYVANDDNLFYYMNKLPFVKRVVDGFKKGLSESLKCSEEQLYQYVQMNFIENS
jgi:GrpB-like predicted nucleotidyltransferase (UPF0157 family)